MFMKLKKSKMIHIALNLDIQVKIIKIENVLIY
jgi:hypothetical protein